nr:hypothetical protein [Tanacetum cinerariifolium]
MGEPLLPDRVYDFPEDELEPHLAYDFFVPAPLPGYAGNLNNNNRLLKADGYLLGELEAMVDEQMVVPAIEEVIEPVAEVEKEQVIALAVDIEEGQIDVLMIDMEEDLVVLFGEDDDFKDDDSEGFDEKEAWEVNEEWLMAPITPPSVPAGQPRSVYEVGGPSTVVSKGPSFPHLALGLFVPPFVIEDLSTRLGNLEYRHGQLEQVGAQVEEGQQTAAQSDETVVELTQQGEHTDAMHFGIGEMGCSIGEKTTRTPVGKEKKRFDEEGHDVVWSSIMHNLINYALFRKNHAMSDKLSPLKRLLRWSVPRLKVRNEEDLSYVGCMLPLMYQLMAVKKTSFPKMECSGRLMSSRIRIRHYTVLNLSNQRFGLREKFDGRLKIEDLAKARGMIEAWWGRTHEMSMVLGAKACDKASLGRFNFKRTSLTGFPAQSISPSNAIVLDSPYLLVLIIETSESRQHERFYTSARNPVKEIFLKMNLPDHKSTLTNSKMEVKVPVSSCLKDS